MTNKIEFSREDLTRFFEENKLHEINRDLFVDGMTPSLYSTIILNPNWEAAKRTKLAIDTVAIPIYAINAAVLPRELRKYIRFDPTADSPLQCPSGQLWYRANEWLEQSGLDLPPLAMDGELDILKVLKKSKDPNYGNVYDWFRQHPDSESVVSASTIRDRLPKLYDGLVEQSQIPDFRELKEQQNYRVSGASFTLACWEKVNRDINWLNFYFSKDHKDRRAQERDHS